MRRYIHNIRCIAVMIIAACAFSSCVYDELREEPTPGVPEDRAMLRVGFQLPVMRAATGNGGGYERGNDGENYIDIRNGGYRIYFFDSENRYIARFIPTLVTGPDNGMSDGYGITGIVPKALEEYDNFKIVVLANWPSYSGNGIIPGVSTINDLCNAEWAQYPCLTNFELDPDEGRTIPFYGVHEYRNVKFVKGKLTTLEEPVALLRAMAKVEVVFDAGTVCLASVVLRGFNSKGCCAPSGAYLQGDYDHNGQWDKDYTKTPHLVGGANDAGQENKAIRLFCKNRSDGSQKETWVCYVPEYRNTDNADGTVNYKSRLELLMDFQYEDEKPFEVYFGDYDDNGKFKENSYYDIMRNNCYRFTVTIGRGGFIIKVKKWENAFDNNIIF